MVVSRDLGVGKVFSTTFAPDQEVGFRLAVAGSKGAVQIWDTSTNAAVRAAFANKVPNIKGDGKGKKWAVKMIDAKFSLPRDQTAEGREKDREREKEKGEGLSVEERVRRRFVNLEGLLGSTKTEIKRCNVLNKGIHDGLGNHVDHRALDNVEVGGNEKL